MPVVGYERTRIPVKFCKLDTAGLLRVRYFYLTSGPIRDGKLTGTPYEKLKEPRTEPHTYPVPGENLQGSQ
jgi:hypothetical protein